MTGKNGIMRLSVGAMQIGDFIRVLPGIPGTDTVTVRDLPFERHDMSRIDALEIRRFKRVHLEHPLDGSWLWAWERIA